MLVALEETKLIRFSKLEPPFLLRWSLVSLLSYRKNSFHPVSQMNTSHFPFHFNCPIPTVSPLELVLSSSACIELSAFASTVKASYNCRKSVARKTLPAALVYTFYRPLIIFFLTFLPSSIYVNLTLALQSAPWRVAQVLGLCEVPLLLHPSEGTR